VSLKRKRKKRQKLKERDMNFREEIKVSKKYKEEYLGGIERLIEKRQKDAKEKRKEYTKDIFKNPEKYREDLKKLLGWPLVDYEKSDSVNTEKELLFCEDGYSVYRMKVEILDGVYMTGLFYKRDNEKKPLVIVQHGGDGTPEVISGLYGNTYNYNEMLERVRKTGFHIFAPQLLLWHGDYGVEYDRKNIDAKLKRVGSSITAIEIFGIMRILDYFEKETFVTNFGMVGLSYGGFYTLFTAAIDTRIKSAISCAFFNTRDKALFDDWSWKDFGYKFDDAEIACLIYPRKICIEIADNDELFECKYGEKSFEKVKEMSKDVGCDWVDFIVFAGTHEFYTEDEPIKKLALDLE